MKIFTKIQEFLAAEPPVKQPPKINPVKKPEISPIRREKPSVNPKIKGMDGAEPTTKPAPPKIDPGTKPQSPPSPIRRDRPSVDPKPKAEIKAKPAEVVERFMRELRTSKAPIKFNISKLKERYED